MRVDTGPTMVYYANLIISDLWAYEGTAQWDICED